VTDCAVCRWAEMTRAQRLRSRLRRLVLPPSVAEVRAHQAHAFAGVFRAFAGVAARTPYDEHRERYARTGDPVELERMLRHVGGPPVPGQAGG
jgi:hypothetical protein